MANSAEKYLRSVIEDVKSDLEETGSSLDGHDLRIAIDWAIEKLLEAQTKVFQPTETTPIVLTDAMLDEICKALCTKHFSSDSDWTTMRVNDGYKQGFSEGYKIGATGHWPKVLQFIAEGETKEPAKRKENHETDRRTESATDSECRTRVGVSSGLAGHSVTGFSIGDEITEEIQRYKDLEHLRSCHGVTRPERDYDIVKAAFDGQKQRIAELDQAVSDWSHKAALHKAEADAHKMRIAKLERENERLQLDGIHTCHNQCRRIACVQRREITDLESRLAIATEALEKYANPETHSMDGNGFKWSGDYFDYETAQAALEKIGGEK